MAIGTGIKSAIHAGKEMAKSGFLKDTVVPGLKSAFSQAGGMKGLGKRVLGGAAIGGAATGTFSALRGGDFWEGAKSGALAGGIGGAARHGYQMGQTRAASSLSTSIQNERTRMTPTASPTGRISNIPISSRRMYEEMFNKGAPMTPSGRAPQSPGGGTRVVRNTPRRPASPSGANPRQVRGNNRRQRNVSNQVHTQTRLSGTNSAAQSVVRG